MQLRDFLNMIAQLIVSTTVKKAESYIDAFCATKNIPPYAILRIKKEKNNLSIDEIRNIATIIPRSNNASVAIVVYDFESAKPEAQNAFLKTLEERAASAQFFVLVSEQSSVLPTIASRCKLVRLEEIKKTKKSVITEYSSLAALLSHYSNIQKDRKKGLAACAVFLDYVQEKIHNHLEKNSQQLQELARFAHKVIQTRRLILHNNINPQMAVDQLVIHLAKITNLA